MVSLINRFNIYILLFLLGFSVFSVMQIYGPGGIISRISVGEHTRQKIIRSLTATNVTSCQAVREEAVAIANFASSWLPPDIDYIRTHPHENSDLARFHVNRIAGLTKLQADMTNIQKQSCASDDL